jgi:hypothetical protein
MTVTKVFESSDIAFLLVDYLYSKWFTANLEVLSREQYKVTVEYTQEQVDNLTESEKEILSFFMSGMFITE